MIYVSSGNLKPGMILAREVWGRSSFLPLICKGSKLTQKAIISLIDKGIPGVYIQCPGGEEIEVNELLTMEVKVRITAEIAQIFKSLQNEKGNVISYMQSLDRVATYLVDVISENSECMMNIVDIKNYNEYAYVHSMQVGILATLIGKKLHYSEDRLKELSMAGMLHDVGKTGIPLEILDKNDKLTDEEFEIIKQHPILALTKLSTCHTLSTDIMNGVAEHHERIDGFGYPNRLKGDEISDFGKIIAIADVYDALTSNRAYRKAWEPHKAITYMIGCADTHFDVELLNNFLMVVAAYPVGVLVELSNGLVGVVIETIEGLPLTPVVKILTRGEYYGKVFDLARNSDYFTLQIVDTLKDAEQIAEILAPSTTETEDEGLTV